MRGTKIIHTPNSEIFGLIFHLSGLETAVRELILLTIFFMEEDFCFNTLYELPNDVFVGSILDVINEASDALAHF